MSHDIATEEADDGALDRCVLCDLTGKRVDVKEATCTGRPATTFEQAFAVERDAGFDDFLHGPVGPRSTHDRARTAGAGHRYVGTVRSVRRGH